MTPDYQVAFDAEIRQCRVFFLGAGFSAAAGVPLTVELLAEALRMFASECPGLYARVEGYAREAMGDAGGHLDIEKLGFSELCTFLEFIELREYGGGERWSENGSREKLAMRFYLAKTLVTRTPPPSAVPQLYRAFAEQLHPRDMVISFNWDGLLEAALSAVGIKYKYGHGDDDAVTISKLHGSVNWRLGEPNSTAVPQRTLPWERLNFGSGMMTQHLLAAQPLLELRTWQHYEPLGEVDPYLVLPGYGKAFDVRANAALWYKPEFIFGLTHNVYLIGLSLAPDDFFVRSLFLSSLPYINSYSGVPGRKIVIINPAESAKEDYAFILRQENVELWNERFDIGHVARFANL